jgi:CoA:oxalate CoA-transferase
MAKPLEGIRVLELANFIAGPFAGTLLADMGADVIKVEPPKGDMARATPPIRNGESVSFMSLNRNKRSIVLDLKQPEARDALLKLAGTSDAVIEAYRPGALEKMGLGAEAMKKVNPKIVYAAVSGFGQTGPYRRRAGVNLIAEAFSGALSVNGYPGKMPLRPGVQTADVFGALFTTYSVLCGLLGAARLKEGRVADISLVEASIAAAAWEAAEYLETNKIPQPLGDKHRLNAPYQLFETKDKRYVAIGAPNDDLFKKFMTTLGLAHHLTDPRFNTYSSRKINEDALIEECAPIIRSMTCAEIEAKLMEAGVPCARANNFEEVFSDPHMVERKMVAEVDHPKLGRIRVARNPVLMDHDGPGLPKPAPVLGQHSAEILSQIGYSQDAIADMIKKGATKVGM